MRKMCLGYTDYTLERIHHLYYLSKILFTQCVVWQWQLFLFNEIKEVLFHSMNASANALKCVNSKVNCCYLISAQVVFRSPVEQLRREFLCLQTFDKPPPHEAETQEPSSPTREKGLFEKRLSPPKNDVIIFRFPKLARNSNSNGSKYCLITSTLG